MKIKINYKVNVNDLDFSNWRNLTKEQVNLLPKEVIDEVKSDLTCYEETNISFEDGQFEVSPGISIKAKYAADHKFIGCVKKETMFTKEEQWINYANVFKSFPHDYKGLRDNSIFRDVPEGQTYKVENGTLVKDKIAYTLEQKDGKLIVGFTNEEGKEESKTFSDIWEGYTFAANLKKIR